jgi:hypothetical protein
VWFIVGTLVSSGGMTEELWIDSWQGQGIFFLFASIQAGCHLFNG